MTSRQVIERSSQGTAPSNPHLYLYTPIASTSRREAHNECSSSRRCPPAWPLFPPDRHDAFVMWSAPRRRWDRCALIDSRTVPPSCRASPVSSPAASLVVTGSSATSLSTLSTLSPWRHGSASGLRVCLPCGMSTDLPLHFLIACLFPETFT